MFRPMMFLTASGGGVSTLWSPTDKEASWSVSPDFATASATASGTPRGGIRGVVSKNSGIVNLRYSLPTAPNSYVGFGTSAVSLSAAPGAGLYGYRPSDGVIVVAGAPNSSTAYTPGTPIELLVNFSTLKFFVYLNGVRVGDSAGYSFTAGTYFPFAQLGATPQATSLTMTPAAANGGTAWQ